MKPVVLFITLFMAIQAAGQSLPEMKQLLVHKDFDTLDQYVTTNRESRWKTSREIVGKYQEGVIEFNHYESSGSRPGRPYRTYRVFVLTAGKRIFYYRLFELGDRTISEYKDSQEYNNFQSTFKQVYNTPLSESDLFATSIVYGAGCGIAGVDPEYKMLLDTLIVNRRVDVLRKWLTSADAEKQLYAIRGYRVLTRLGHELTREEARVLTMVRKKKGNVYTCSGCAYWASPFQQEVSKIETMPVMYLAPKSAKMGFFLTLILFPFGFYWAGAFWQ
jgi:hypothetical protein